MTKDKARRNDQQKKRRSIPDRHLLQYPSSNPACIYPVQIRFRLIGKHLASAKQSFNLSLIWHTCHSHLSLCNIPKFISMLLIITLAYQDAKTRSGMEKCDLIREYKLAMYEKLEHLLLYLVLFNEIALKQDCNDLNTTAQLQGNH